MEVEVVIAGGGLTGAALGCALASADVSTVLVEPFAPSGGGGDGREPVDGRCLTLAPASRNMLEVLGIWSVLADTACPIHEIHVSDRGHPGFTRLSAREAGADALGHAVPIEALTSALWAELRRSPVVDLLCPASVEDLRVEPDCVVAQVDAGAGTREVRARVLAIADGARSRIRERAGIRAVEFDYGREALVSTVGVEVPHHNRAYERFLPEGPLAVLPRPGQRVAVVWTLPPARAAALRDCPDEVFIDELQQAFGWRLGALGEPGTRQVHGLSRVRVDDPVGHRVAVVGNAAHTLHPVAGQGFNLALRDCAALAETIDQVRSQGADPGREVALRRYASWRRRDTRRIEWFTDGLLRLFASRLPPIVAGRDLAMCAIDLLPILKRPLLRRTMGFGGRVPRLSRGLPLAGSRRETA